ncbi:MAG: AAA family ATPase [Magnetococcales bacterium]|nr:AAA family ATPase [Magnetococcales bacterium]
MMELNEDLQKWFSSRPRWLQKAATQLLEQPCLTEKDISDLVILCQREADGELPDTTISFPASVFSKDAEGSLHLCSISDIEGVNALAPRKPLKFGKDNITIVYGNNGSGKSGYVRLLKHVCGARQAGTLLPNVYQSAPAVQKACISYKRDGKLESHTWSGQGICDALKSVDIFDTAFGKVFVSIEDEVSYEPPLLLFFSNLIDACEKVPSALNTKAKGLQSKKPNIPDDKKKTFEGNWYGAINAETTTQVIDDFCTFNSTHEAELQTLQQRLAAQSPSESAKNLKTQKQYIDTLVRDAQKFLGQLSNENYRRIVAAKEESILKKRAADMAAEKIFSGSELEGIGSDVWKALWEAARKYSVSAAYKNVDYPNVSDGARCVLCHQILTPEARDRLISFEDFVKGEMQKAATEAAKEYETVSQTIEALPTSDALKTRIDAAGISPEIASQVTGFFAQLQARKDLLPGIDSEESLPDPLPSPPWIEEANALSKSLGECAAQYDEDAKSDNREEIKKKRDSLETRKWLSENRAAIDEEVTLLQQLNQMKMAIRSADTTALSRKKGELAEALITEAFVQRFNNELNSLGASRVKVELVKSKVSRGRVLHKLQLKGSSRSGRGPADVLSEGEHRIVSIAAFLADVTGRTYSAPFVFDDPISSLDQDFEEAVVQRLCSIASNRQVILFTHRLSLMVMVQDYAEKKKIDPEIICIREESWGTGEPGDTSLQAKKPLKALNTLIDTVTKAKKLYNDKGFNAYQSIAKEICSEFRILLERMIENELLSDVVQRYRRAINTKGKIENLAKISEEDCDYFDDLMTKYSRYEHSQPIESPVSLPKPEELESDLIKLKHWQSEFKSRSKTPAP